jgi:hypothetical protein
MESILFLAICKVSGWSVDDYKGEEVEEERRPCNNSMSMNIIFLIGNVLKILNNCNEQSPS